MTKIILLNGPPGSGKDSVGSALKNLYKYSGPVYLEKFANPIRDAAMATFPWLNESNFEESKNKEIFNTNTTLRHWMIDFSERLMKPCFGCQIFGKLLFERIENRAEGLFIITDSGFELEAQVLIKRLGKDNITLIRLQRENKNFSSDSRDYINLPCPSFDIFNEENKIGKTAYDIYVKLQERKFL